VAVIVPRYLRFTRSLALVGTTAVVGGWWVGCRDKEASVSRDPEDKAGSDGGHVTKVTPKPPAPSGECSGMAWVREPGMSTDVMRDVRIPCAAGSHCGLEAGTARCVAGASSFDKPTPCGPIECDQYYCRCTDADAGHCHCPRPMPTPGPLAPPDLRASRVARRRVASRRAERVTGISSIRRRPRCSRGLRRRRNRSDS